jgi:hypothetical protein
LVVTGSDLLFINKPASIPPQAGVKFGTYPQVRVYTVEDILIDPDFVSLNQNIQTVIDSQVKQNASLMSYMPWHQLEFVDIPVLFISGDVADVDDLLSTSSTVAADAFTGNAVNMQISNFKIPPSTELQSRAVIPRTFGPSNGGSSLFEQNIIQNLATYFQGGLQFVDTWHAYHRLGGAVHCATNNFRKPFIEIRYYKIPGENE